MSGGRHLFLFENQTSSFTYIIRRSSNKSCKRQSLGQRLINNESNRAQSSIASSLVSNNNFGEHHWLVNAVAVASGGLFKTP